MLFDCFTDDGSTALDLWEDDVALPDDVGFLDGIVVAMCASARLDAVFLLIENIHPREHYAVVGVHASTRLPLNTWRMPFTANHMCMALDDVHLLVSAPEYWATGAIIEVHALTGARRRTITHPALFRPLALAVCPDFYAVCTGVGCLTVLSPLAWKDKGGDDATITSIALFEHGTGEGLSSRFDIRVLPGGAGVVVVNWNSTMIVVVDREWTRVRRIFEPATESAGVIRSIVPVPCLKGFVAVASGGAAPANLSLVRLSVGGHTRTVSDHRVRFGAVALRHTGDMVVFNERAQKLEFFHDVRQRMEWVRGCVRLSRVSVDGVGAPAPAPVSRPRRRRRRHN